MTLFHGAAQSKWTVNRKEGIDQESIQLPNTFRSKTPKGKKDALKVTDNNQTISRKPKGQFLSKTLAKRLSKIKKKKKKIPDHTCKDIQ